jgi:hypothetical protein
MKELLDNTPYWRSNVLRMVFDSKKQYCYVEGPADQIIYKRIFPKEIIFQVLSGKPKVISELEYIFKNKPEAKSNVFGICDSDHDRLLGKRDQLKNNNIFLTDENDLEMMLLSIKHSYENLIEENLSIDNIEKFKNTILNEIFEVCYQIGLWRFISRKKTYNINFNLDKSYKLFIGLEENKVTFNQEEFIKILENQNKTLDFRSLNNEVTQLQSEKYSIWDICRGHDVTHVFLLVVKKLIQGENNHKTGTGKSENISHEYIEKSLRKAVRQDDFEHKKLYKEVSNFIANAGHKISNQSA